MDKISKEEHLEISRELQKHHMIFDAIWSLGDIISIESQKIKTAAVSFDADGKFLNFYVNKNFWDILTFIQKCFVISHECMHVSLNHGERSLSTEDSELLNIAQDLVINEILVRKFGFVRKEVDPENRYCWLDKFFSDENLFENQSSEFYYNKLKTLKKLPEYSLVDEHGFSSDGMGSGSETDDFSYVIDYLNDSLSEEEKQDIEGFIKENSNDTNMAAGIGTGRWFFVDVKAKKKKKWESVIKNWVRKKIKNYYNDVQQWAITSRRYLLLPDSVKLPSDYEMETKTPKKEKVDVWFFQDTSGSCSGYHKRFFAAAKSIPEDKFNIRMFCFDTRVFETTLVSGKLYGFGGTSFKIMERKIQSIMAAEKIDYPDAVFVITDGMGDKVYPQFPNRWHWFLIRDVRSYIPKESKIYKLSEYE